jgi:hypothetical protein
MRKKLIFFAATDVDSLILQYGGSLEKLKLLPEIETTLKPDDVTGIPEVGLRVAPKRRPKDDYEKLDELKKVLEKHCGIERGRPKDSPDDPRFVSETCEVIRVVIPDIASKGGQGSSSPGLSMWISLGDQKRASLCLLEGTGGDYENPYNYGRTSTYTLLQSLVHFARSQGRGRLPQVPNDPHPNPHVKPDATHTPSLIEEYHNVIQFNLAYDFVHDPLNLLRSWNAQVGTPKTVDVLYQVREFGRDSTTGWKETTVFGYALSIQAC